jgi:spermidine/putrescine transport system permease protein
MREVSALSEAAALVEATAAAEADALHSPRRLDGIRARTLGWLHSRPHAPALGLLAPGTLWLVLFFLIPIAIMFVYSWMPRGIYGGVERGFTLEHYARFFDPLYLHIVQRTALWSLLCTGGCLGLGYPVAYVISRAGRYRDLLIFLVVLPFWTSFLVRTFAMIFLLRDSGLVNGVLLGLGAIEQPLTLLYTPFAVMAGLVYGFLPFMILPIYASLEKLEPALLEAAEVLGARPLARFMRVTLPLSMPGVIAGCLLVFIPALGSFLTSDLLGGAKQVMLGNLVQNQFSAARNWPFGSAASFIVMSLVLIGVLAYLRVTDRGRDPGSAR